MDVEQKAKACARDACNVGCFEEICFLKALIEPSLLIC